MAKQRFDNKPMNRAANAAGDVNAVLLKQEVEPSSILEVNRRHGSVRNAAQSNALGVIVDGQDMEACWFSTQQLTASASWSISFSVKIGQHLDSSATAKVPILTVQKDENNYWEVYTLYTSPTTCTINIGARLQSNNEGPVAGDSAKASGTVVNVTLTYSDADDKFKIYTSTDAVEELTEAPTETDKFTVEVGGNSALITDRVSCTPHVVSNLMVYTGVLDASAAAALYANRTPSTSNLQNHYLLSAGGQAVSSEVTSDHDMLLCDPSPPVAAADSVVFNGRSSALRVQMTPEIEQFFTAKNRAALFSADYTFYLKGKLLREGVAQTLLDFNDLGLLAIDSTGRLTFTVSGYTHTYDDVNLTLSNPDFEIFATKTADEKIFIVHDGDYDNGGVTTLTTFRPPYFDMDNVPKLWVGAASAEDGTKYCGTLTKFAMYSGVVNADLGPSEDALVYMEGASFIDKSQYKTGLLGLAKTPLDGVCSYTAGPLVDADHVAVVGGHILGEGEVIGLTKGTQRMALAFKKDAEALRIGSKLLVASNNVGHIIDEEAESVREYGVPSPWRNVSVQPTAPGVLEGAASYGYRYVTGDGTYGPIRRLDPAYITETAGRFIVGSSVGADGGVSELGETFLKTSKGGHLTSGADSTTTDIFGTVNDNKRIVVEVFAKVEELEMEDLPETIWARGLQGVETNGNSKHQNRRQFWHSSGHQMDLNNDFQLQVSFKYDSKRAGSVDYDRGSSYYYRGMYPAQGIFGYGNFADTHRNATYSRSSRRNPSICAYLIGDDSASHTGRWYHRYKTDNTVRHNQCYGLGNDSTDTTDVSPTDNVRGNPRLVIGIAREEFEHFHEHGEDGLLNGDFGAQSNHKWITFTDATELVAGAGSNESIWVQDHDYSLFVGREDDALKVYVYDATDDKWYSLTGRAMGACVPGKSNHGGSIPAYSGTDYFANWTNPHSVEGMTLVVKSIGLYSQVVPVIYRNGQPTSSVAYGYSGGSGTYDTPKKLVGSRGGSDNGLRVYCNHELMPMPPETIVYQVRVWSDVIPESTLQANASLRGAAQPGGVLASDNVIDAHFTWSDSGQEKETFVDSNTASSGGILWTSKYARYSTTKAKIYENDVAHALSKRQPVMMLGNRSSSSVLTNSPLALYYSNRGEGSMTLQTMGQAAYVISNTFIPGGGSDTNFALKSDYEFINDFHEWNMYSIQLRVRNEGGAATLYVEGMAINGNTIFDTPISEPGAVWTEADETDWITLGGTADTDNVNNELDVYIGEFRIWADGQGPRVNTGEPGPNGWNVNNRIGPDDWSALLAYWRMLEGDLTVAGGTEMKNIGTATGYGVFSDLTLDNNSMLQDDRTAEAGTDAVAFPAPPRPDITAIELFRTITQGIVDVDIEDDVQKALDSVRYAPLYFVARIAADTRHYVDDSPNSALGFAAPWTEFAIPDKIKQFFTWQGQVGVIGEENRVYYTEPGPFGWETFPYSLTYEARIGGGGAGELLGCRSTGDTLYLFGRSWATALVGSPGNETEFPLGGGVGAYSARATLDMTGMVYAFNGRLWVIDRVGQVDFKAVDAGATFQDLLPTHDNVRLACSSELQSIFIIDENTGDALRVFTPTGEVTVEKRYAIGVGDSGAGVDQWVNIGGSYSSGNTAVYGDDVRSTSTPASDVGTLNGSVFTTTPDMSANIHTGMRVGIVDSAGVTLDTTITTIAGADVTLASVSGLTGGGAAATIYFGASADGMLIDTGYIDSGNDNSMAAESQISIQSGTGVEVGFAASPMAGTRSSIADAQFVTVATNETTVGGNLRGRFLRCILRNRKPEATAISHIDMDITSPYD